MNQGVKIHGSLLAKNTVLSFIGSAVPPIVGVITIPYIVHGLGVERFGVLSVAGTVLLYFSMFDLGVGKATTMFVAEILGEGKLDSLPSLVWTALVVQVSFGIIGGATLAALTPFLVESALKIPSHLAQESKSMFYLLGASIPIAIYWLSLKGVLEAAQRFDLVVAVKIPSNSLIFLIPAVAILLGFYLEGVAVLLFVAQLFTALTYTLLCLRVFPMLRDHFSITTTWIPRLLTYGGWVTACNAVIPVVLYLDRFLIGYILSIGTVSYYTVPFEILARLQIVPASLALTLFPAFSTLGATRKEEVGRLYASSMKYLLMIMGPITLILVPFGGEILRLWLGSEFGEKSTLVFQLLVIGFFLNSLGWLPNTVLLGMGRPDLVAKLFLLDLLVYLPFVWLLIVQGGIEGAALAMILRGVVEVALFFGASWKIMSFPDNFLRQSGLLRAGALCGVLIGMMSLLALPMFTRVGLTQLIVTMGFIGLFTLTAWGYLLDAEDRNQLIASFQRITCGIGVAK